MKLIPGFGGAPYSPTSKKVIRLILKGCVNRPFFYISVMENEKEPDEAAIEQIGTYDPMPNNYNEKLVSINFKRLEYWLKNDAAVTEPVSKLLGLCGYFPIHFKTFVEAWENRKIIKKTLEELKITAASLPKESAEPTGSTSFSTSSESLSDDSSSTSLDPKDGESPSSDTSVPPDSKV